jgi:molybdopterin-guanine dinucleotide biosynthesis protein
MKVIGLAGWNGAGKTTVLTRVIPLFRKQGLAAERIVVDHSIQRQRVLSENRQGAIVGELTPT